MPKYRVSADIGGTFTDFVLMDEAGQVKIGKVPTTPSNPAKGIMNGINQWIANPKDIDFFVHGTTVGLNAFLERRGARVILLMTEGISDTYTIARGHRLELYKLHYKKPKQLVPRMDVHEVKERLAWDGSVLKPFDPKSLDSVIEKVKAEKIEAIAVCLLHAYKNPKHELEVGRYLEKALPNVSISLSHKIASEWREVERASSTVMDAYVAPVVDLYLNTLKTDMNEIGMNETIHVMRSNGGVMTEKAARQHPISTLMSGPVGGSIGGVQLAKASGRKNLLCVDMGGTSFDLSLVVNGEAKSSNETILEGLPLLMSIVDISTVGAGGGSLAWIEKGGLRVGPQSAGSVPGPVCYGRGGTEPTITDANLFLGRLGEDSLLGGDMTLDVSATAKSMVRLGAKIGLSDVELAEGMIAIGNAKMADAMRTITVGQGIDPRDFTLVAFGGAGPMHAVELARELDIREILIPAHPGTYSAWGMLHSNIRHDFSKSHFTVASEDQAAEISKIYNDLEAQARTVLTDENISQADMEFIRSAELRYLGQEYTLNIPINESGGIGAMLGEFHVRYKERYGHASEGSPVEIITLRLAAIGKLKHITAKPAIATKAEDPVTGQRSIIFDGQTYETSIYERSKLTEGPIYQSPAVIEEASATTIIPPGYSFGLDKLGNILITQEG